MQSTKPKHGGYLESGGVIVHSVHAVRLAPRSSPVPAMLQITERNWRNEVLLFGLVRATG